MNTIVFDDFAHEVVCTFYPRGGAKACAPLLPGRSLKSIQNYASRNKIAKEGRPPRRAEPVILYPRDPDESSADRALRNFKPCTHAANGPRYLIGAMG